MLGYSRKRFLMCHYDIQNFRRMGLAMSYKNGLNYVTRIKGKNIQLWAFGDLDEKKIELISRCHKGNKEILVKKKKESKFTSIWNNFASKCRHGRDSLRKYGYKCSGCKEIKNIRRIFFGAMKTVAGILFILPMFSVFLIILHFYLRSGSIFYIFFLS